MRTSRLVILVIGLLSSWALADIVYLKDGKRLEGKATNDGNSWLVATPQATLRLPLEDVLYVDANATAPGRVKFVASAPASSAWSSISIDRLSMPESLAFLEMRNLAATASGGDSSTVRQAVDRFRAFSHDRKRKVMGGWIQPSDFTTHFEHFKEFLKDANELERKWAHTAATNPAQETLKKTDLQSALAKFEDAARQWDDPVLGKFLLGVRKYHAKQWTDAEECFHFCTAAAPRVAAFHQGLALCMMMNEGQTVPALAEALDAFKFEPESQTALALLHKAMAKYPGTEVKGRIYQEAKALAELYDDPKPGGDANTVLWVMPGLQVAAASHEWTSKENVLPIPPYDRLVFMQAVATPLDKHTLLVDPMIARDPNAVLLVQVDANTIVRAFIHKSTSNSNSKVQPPPLAVLVVSGYEFTSAPPEEDVKADVNEPLTAYHLGVFEEMGEANQPLLSFTTKITTFDAEGKIKLSTPLAAGDAASPIFLGGKLAGFLAGKTDATVDGGGSDILIPMSQIVPLIKTVKTASSQVKSLRKKTAAVQQISGQAFVVYSIVGEKLRN